MFSLGQYCRAKQLEYHNAGIQGRRQAAPQIDDNEQDENCPSKKAKVENNGIGEDVIQHNISFIRVNYNDGEYRYKLSGWGYIGETSGCITKTTLVYV